MRWRSNHRAGLMAEQLALLWLMLKGYRLVARRYKTRVGEIDLILRRGGVLACVEVKARRAVDDAAYAIHHKNQTRVVAAAQHFLAHHPNYRDLQVRFDVVLIAWYKRPKHLPHAFTAG
jgi:putative endonuclease